MSDWKKVKLGEIANIKTGKLDSNAAVTNGLYPFFTCDPNTLRINEWAYDTEAVLLAGNNASGNYTAKYYIGNSCSSSEFRLSLHLTRVTSTRRKVQISMQKSLRILYFPSRPSPSSTASLNESIHS